MVSAARGEGSWWNGRRARVSSVERLAEACLSYTSVKSFEEAGTDCLAAWTRLCGISRLQRGWGDCYGHILVATGRAEVMLDPILSPWDCAALLPIVEEAGGTFTDWRGSRTIHGGSGISTNGKLLEPLLGVLKGESGKPQPADRKGGRQEAP
jgi:fructose-1,6-bisphosphatase/inositol monophosphatase family enzyme